MERFIADLVKDFETGKLDRREFCKTVALAATVYAAGAEANAQAPRGFKVLGINHLSYSCRTTPKPVTSTPRCSTSRACRTRTAASART